MKSKRRTVITLETFEIIKVKVRTREQSLFCKLCHSQVRMLTPDAAAVIMQSSSRAVYRWVEAGELHFLETSSGSLLLCGNSLLALTQQ